MRSGIVSSLVTSPSGVLLSSRGHLLSLLVPVRAAEGGQRYNLIGLYMVGVMTMRVETQ